jgi:hypothetical protein
MSSIRSRYGFFVCRLKDNAKYEAVETLFEADLPENAMGVMNVEQDTFAVQRG